MPSSPARLERIARATTPTSRSWIEALNRADVDALADFYTEGAVNHQVAECPVEGRAAIREKFASGFASVFQRGYWDTLSFLRCHGLPIPKAPKRRRDRVVASVLQIQVVQVTAHDDRRP